MGFDCLINSTSQPSSPVGDGTCLLSKDPEVLKECTSDEFKHPEETMAQGLKRHAVNLLHFFVEDWFISALLGCITAALSISVDVSYEYLNHYRAILFDFARDYDKMLGFVSWVGYLGFFVTAAALVCKYISPQAIGSGIPEVKVIMNGFFLPNYLTMRTLVAKVLSLTLTLGSGLPVGKEGPFVHMGAIVGHLLSKLTKAWQSTAFFSNEGREIEILASGCSVGIACTFSSPAGAVLYGIECTHKYFAVKNYWRAFFATTCSALIFRFANAAIIPPHIAGTITAYYQTSFPNEVFLVEEIICFIIIGLVSGLFGALFVLVHRRITYFKKRNRTFKAIFGRNSLSFTIFMAIIVGIVTYPDGFGRFIAGKFTFRETLGDFIANCTMSLHNVSSSMGCSAKVIQRWTIDDLEKEGPTDRPTSLDGSMDATVFMPNVFPALFGYLFVNFFLVAICITLALPAGIFVPSFVIGACGGRIIGELMVVMFPAGIRGVDGPQIYPGLYAVVGAAAYTGAVTHSLSIAVIVCETTGQLSPLLPVLVALMVANAVSSFLQPSIYESIINIRKYPHLAELPPSRISVHTLKVEQIMVRDVVFITKLTSYKELRELLLATPHLRSYPLVTDEEEKILLGSVSRKYLHFLLTDRLGPDPSLLLHRSRRRKSRTNTTTNTENNGENINNLNKRMDSISRRNVESMRLLPGATPPKMSVINERNLFGNTLLSISPLHEDRGARRNVLGPLLLRQQGFHQMPLFSKLDGARSSRNRSALLRQPIDLDDELAIDAAPFQLVIGTSLYKVHTLFSLLGLNHAYVTHRGRLVGVVALRELRAALANIYTRGAVPPDQSMSRLRLNSTGNDLILGLSNNNTSRNNSEENEGNGNNNNNIYCQTTPSTVVVGDVGGGEGEENNNITTSTTTSVLPPLENNQNKNSNSSENLLINSHPSPTSFSSSSSSPKNPKNFLPSTTTSTSSSPSFVNEMEDLLRFGSQQVGNFEINNEENEEDWATIERPRAHSDYGFGKNKNSKKLTQRRPWKR